MFKGSIFYICAPAWAFKILESLSILVLSWPHSCHVADTSAALQFKENPSGTWGDVDFEVAWGWECLNPTRNFCFKLSFPVVLKMLILYVNTAFCFPFLSEHS